MTNRYDHPDSAAVRTEAARARPAGPDDGRLAKRYDHADSRQGREPVPPQRAITAAERLARRYDHPDSKALRDRPPPENAQVTRERVRAAKRYDHPSSQEGRPTPEGEADDEDRPGGSAGKEGASTIRPPEGFDATDPVFKEFAKTAAELGLDQKGAERILALRQQEVAARAEAFGRQALEWRAELEGDAEITAHVEDARDLLREHAGEDVRKLFQETWIGDHPGIVRLLVKLARQLKETRG